MRPAGPIGGLPVEMSTFIGRSVETAAVADRLRSSRFVTLLGIGGIGKTRIALRVAADIARHFSGGVRLVQLAHVSGPDLVANAVATALGLPTRVKAWTADSISRQLASAEVLIVLDGCEHVVDAVAAVVDSILFRCPAVAILVTSRGPLRLAYEVRMPVGPLPTSIEDPATVSAAQQCPAVQLFVERGRSAAPDFRLDGSNVAAVCALCQRLDGIPLAIELAASRLAALGVEDILTLLETRPLQPALAGGRPGGNVLEATIQWSYDHLSESERVIWRRLCVFAGPFDLQAARYACIGPDPETDLPDLVESLVDKSMLNRLPGALRARFTILETLRSFGVAELRLAGEESLMMKGVLDWASSWSQGLAPEQAQSVSISRIDSEMTNIRVALDSAGEHPEWAVAGLRVCTNIWVFWRLRGPIEEGRRRIQHLLEMATAPEGLAAKAMWVAGALALIQNDIEAGTKLLTESREIGTRIGDSSVIAWSTYYLGLAAYFKSELDSASELLRSARHAQIENVDRFGTAMATTLYGQVELARGRYHAAATNLEEALTLIRMLGDRWVEAYVLWLLGLVTSKQRDQPAAEHLIEEALAINEELHDLTAIALCVEALAWIAMLQGDAARCARLLGAARRTWYSLSAQIEGPLRLEHDTAATAARAQLGISRYMLLEKEGFAHGLRGQQIAVGTEISPQVLTHREFEIARLAADGLSNREIAHSLNISKRTIDSHLDHIFTKVGVRGRVALTNWLRDRP